MSAVPTVVIACSGPGIIARSARAPLRAIALSRIQAPELPCVARKEDRRAVAPGEQAGKPIQLPRGHPHGSSQGVVRQLGRVDARYSPRTTAKVRGRQFPSAREDAELNCRRYGEPGDRGGRRRDHRRGAASPRRRRGALGGSCLLDGLSARPGEARAPRGPVGDLGCARRAEAGDCDGPDQRHLATLSRAFHGGICWRPSPRAPGKPLRRSSARSSRSRIMRRRWRN
jgi:hypothetical protein